MINFDEISFSTNSDVELLFFISININSTIGRNIELDFIRMKSPSLKSVTLKWVIKLSVRKLKE